MLALLLRFLCVKKLPWLGLDSLRDWDIGLLAYMYAGVSPPSVFFHKLDKFNYYKSRINQGRVILPLHSRVVFS